ncbi:cytochrome P450 302a1, mitochondrial isoform X2 [Galleria mellonella]|uniref:Cytochrome P450 302a1, mitochondrial isoform X2 n=1 Tax=Galleria mellonella TaxID=7137 RepID=A0A6J3C774_GALME|nr:cytochrome P450 302a1, mitochondrial isoform X2 [Galleria mellonella]
MFKFVQTKINNALLNKKCVNIKLRLKKISDQPSKDNNGDSGLKKFDEIPGPKSYPLIGTLYKYLPFIGDYDAEALDKNAWLNWKRYGTLVREEPGVNVLHVFEPDDIEAVFRQDHRYPARRSHVAMQHYRVNKPHLYNTGGLLSTNGPDWWRLRSTFQKNFTGPESVKSHVKTTDCVVKEFVHWIKEKKLSAHEDFLFYLNRLNLEIIGVVAFNERFQSFSQSEQNSNSRSSKTIAAAFGSNSGIMKLDKGFLWKFFKTPLYKKLVESQDYLGKISIEILLKRIKFFEENKTDSDQSLLASFLLQPNVDIKDIVGMMVDILMAAIDTTVVVTQNMLASRLPLFVKDPLAFKPERWLRASSNYENLHPFLSLPFGFGPRSCIARRLAEQNICITLIRVIREFEIKWNGGELGVRTYLINKPDQPVALSFIKRSM